MLHTKSAENPYLAKNPVSRVVDAQQGQFVPWLLVRESIQNKPPLWFINIEIVHTKDIVRCRKVVEEGAFCLSIVAMCLPHGSHGNIPDSQLPRSPIVVKKKLLHILILSHFHRGRYHDFGRTFRYSGTLTLTRTFWHEFRSSESPAFQLPEVRKARYI